MAHDTDGNDIGFASRAAYLKPLRRAGGASMSLVSGCAQRADEFVLVYAEPAQDPSGATVGH